MYEYKNEREKIFTEDGQVTFIAIRDQVKALLAKAGAFRFDAIRMTGDSFLTIACIDRLVELKEIVPLRPKDSCCQVYATPEVHNL